MKHITKLALLGAFAVTVMGADAAIAKEKKHKTSHHAAVTKEEKEPALETPHAGEKPLMVLRFNQEKVAYEWPLYETLTKALEAHPQAQFDVVSVASRSRALDQQLNNNEAASQDLSKVLGTLKEIGMPESRFTVSKIYDDVKTSEVRFYVH